MSSKIAKCSYTEELKLVSILVNRFFIQFIIYLSSWQVIHLVYPLQYMANTDVSYR